MSYLIVVLLILASFLLKRTTKTQESQNLRHLDKLYSSVDTLLEKAKEVEIPIHGLYVYPIRGIRSPHKVDSIELGPFGVKYDREIMLCSPENLKHVTTCNTQQMGCLTQRLIGGKVEITTSEPQRLVAKGLPVTFVMDLDIEDPSKIGEWFVGAKHAGYKYNDKVNDWFSAAIDKKVVAIHATFTQEKWKGLDPKRHIHMREGDIRKTFTTDASFHLVNKKSVDELRQRVDDAHPQGLDNFWVDAEQFRSNLVIDTDSFNEDTFIEMRVGTCLLRTAGPCIRCNAIRTNWDKQVRVDEEEPNRTLTKFRKVPDIGIIFGMYYQQELLSRQEYSHICPEKMGYQSYDQTIAKNPINFRQSDSLSYVKISKDDKILVRHQEIRPWKKHLMTL